MFAPSSHRFVSHGPLAAVVIGLFMVTRISPLLAWDARDRLASGTPVIWSGGAVPVPTEGLDAWTSGREAAGLPADSSLLQAPLDIAALNEAVAALLDEDLLGWERAWVAAGASEGAWSDELAARWIDVLDAVESAGAIRSDDRRALASLSLHARGSAMAALSSRCLPDDPVQLAALDAFVALELAVPTLRVGAPDEASGALPVALTPVTELARSAVALQTAWSDPAWPDPGGSALEAGCGAGHVVLLAGAVRWRPSESVVHADALRLAAEVGPVPERVVRRIAAHAYLMTDTVRLDALVDVEGLRGRDHGPTAARLKALRAGAARDLDLMVRLAGSLEGDDVLARWIRAEAARHDGRWDEAVTMADALVAEDSGFVGAILTRASAHLQRGTAELALADLEYLRLRWAAEPLYADWITRLSAALAARRP